MRPYGASQYSSDFYTNILLRDDMVQEAYFKHNASIALRGADDAWEVAVIGNNLGDEIITCNCVNSNIANGVVFGGQVTGAASGGPAGADELGCNVERGRAIWVRFSLKISAL